LQKQDLASHIKLYLLIMDMVQLKTLWDLSIL